MRTPVARGLYRAHTRCLAHNSESRIVSFFRNRSSNAQPTPEERGEQLKPILETALGTEIPEDIPDTPLHIRNITERRLKWNMRTMNEERLTPEDEQELQRAMARVTKTTRQGISFMMGESGPSQARMEFFSGPDDATAGVISVAEELPGIEIGRVIEIRRNAADTLGLILAHVSVSGRRRMLVLHPSGEIWPIAETDVQFVMPASLFSAEQAAQCWSTDLLKLWAEGQDIGVGGSTEEVSAIIGEETAQEMTQARRKAATLLRRVVRETERMEVRLSSGSRDSGTAGGIEAGWEHFAPKDPEQRTSVTSSEVAEYLLNASDSSKPIVVRPNTLPAFAAHRLLMRRPELFLADERSMWQTGRFLVRSSNERQRIHRVIDALDNDESSLKEFVLKASKVKDILQSTGGNASSALPEWTSLELDMIWAMLLTLFETRSTQKIPLIEVSTAISKVYNLGSGTIDQFGYASVPKLLSEIGVLPPTDSSRASITEERASRTAIMDGVQLPVFGPSRAEPTPSDAALDPLRTELSHRVFIIDDATAKELDDGIALERNGDNDFWVHVHVADPTRFLARNDPTALRASYFGSSLYLPEGTVPLLPSDLGQGTLSLGQSSTGQSTMVFSARVDRTGNVLEEKVALGWIKSAVVTTYETVDKALGNANPQRTHPFGRLEEQDSPVERQYTTLSESDIADLSTLRELSTALRARRSAKAGLEWAAAQSTISIVNPAKPLPGLFDRTQLPAHPQAFIPGSAEGVQYNYVVDHDTPLATTQAAVSVVAELMILANRVAAKFCADRDIAAPFRGQIAPQTTNATPAGTTIESLLAQRMPGTAVIDMAAVAAANLLMPAVTTTSTPMPHWIMGFSEQDHGYVRATSPLRRYDDLFVHWQIKAALAADAGLTGADSVMNASEAEPLLQRMHFLGQRAKQASMVAGRFWRVGLYTQRATGPLPKGYTADSTAIDLTAPMKARVITQPSIRPDRVTTDVHVEGLGTIASLRTHPRDIQYALGDEVAVRFSPDKSILWPNPIAVVVPA